MMRDLSSRLVWLGLCAAFLFTGCAREANVQGKLVMDGEPYKPAANEQVLLNFETAGGPNDYSFSGLVKRDGTFTVVGNGSDGIPPGKYRITIRVMPYGPTAAPNAGDKLAGALSGPDSPLTCEVKRGTTVTIDLAQRAVTAE
jgi:hypothetical protein